MKTEIEYAVPLNDEKYKSQLMKLNDAFIDTATSTVT